MNPPAARQVRARGGDRRRVRAPASCARDHIDAADLVLTATADQQDYVVALRPDAAGRTFVLGEFGRLLAARRPGGAAAGRARPRTRCTPAASRIVAAVDAARAAATPPLPADDLDDPWGRGDQTFTRVADEIEDTIVPLAALLVP